MMARDRSLSLRVLVAPGAGRLRLLPPQRFTEGSEWVEAGQAVALLEQAGRQMEICAPIGGRVAAVLGLEGEPVALGQALMAIEPAP